MSPNTNTYPHDINVVKEILRGARETKLMDQPPTPGFQGLAKYEEFGIEACLWELEALSAKREEIKKRPYMKNWSGTIDLNTQAAELKAQAQDWLEKMQRNMWVLY